MGETTPDPQPRGFVDRRNPDTRVQEQRSAIEERRLKERSITDKNLREERSITDKSLREERSITDELLGPKIDEERVVEVVQESRIKAENALREVRADSDAQLEKQAEGLPEASEKLEQVAESLSKAAASLTGVAAILQESSVGLVSNIAQIAEELKGTAGTADALVPAPAPPPPSLTLTDQLAEIAEGIAEITSTLSDERRDADESLRQEREVTDRIIVQEMTQVETNLGHELREERRALRQDRDVTDEDLANERRNTDNAVEHVLGLLAEEQRDHANTAQSVATRNEFLSIVSHDLRGPLTTISGLAVLIERQAATDEAGERLRGWAAGVRRSVSVMERLIGDLLDFNSFEDGQLRVAAERLDIRPLIHGAVDAFHGVATSKGLSLEADLPADPVIAKHDPPRMLQVLSNLINNAIKFTAKGGAIRISVARAGPLCLVSVSDSGVGIPDRELTAIFERFRQLDPADRTGLGLGLYISRWIVEAHGGRIWAESKVGTGTTFRFTLPEE